MLKLDSTTAKASQVLLRRKGQEHNANIRNTTAESRHNAMKHRREVGKGGGWEAERFAIDM
jgi:hypothetical protein